MLTLFLLIFHPPEFIHFADELLYKGGICRELDGLYLSHEAPVVVIVAVVISQHAD